MLNADQVVTFICDILHRLGFPNTIITDLGSNFHSHEFRSFCERSSIEVKYVSVAHPRANGQVERTNSLIFDGLKKRLYDENSKKGGKWINEISLVVWGLLTQLSKAKGQSPFFLIYGSEAILPADVIWKSSRLAMFKEDEANTARHLELDSAKSDAMHCCSRPVTYKEFVVTTTEIFNDAL
jgi:transposase InsO family protein